MVWNRWSHLGKSIWAEKSSAFVRLFNFVTRARQPMNIHNEAHAGCCLQETMLTCFPFHLQSLGIFRRILRIFGYWEHPSSQETKLLRREKRCVSREFQAAGTQVNMIFPSAAEMLKRKIVIPETIGTIMELLRWSQALHEYWRPYPETPQYFMDMRQLESNKLINQQILCIDSWVTLCLESGAGRVAVWGRPAQAVAPEARVTHKLSVLTLNSQISQLIYTFEVELQHGNCVNSPSLWQSMIKHGPMVRQGAFPPVSLAPREHRDVLLWVTLQEFLLWEAERELWTRCSTSKCWVSAVSYESYPNILVIGCN